MITLEMCLNYIEHPKKSHIFKDIRYPVTLSEAQKKFLGNLCEGKITDTPRNFGKTFLIKLYCECLNYYTDMVKYDLNIKKDDYISLKETINSWRPYNTNPYQLKGLVEAYDECGEKMLKEYNSAAEYMEKIKQEIENTTE